MGRASPLESPTLVERIVLPFHLPYPLGCLVLAVIIDVQAMFLTTYLSTSDLTGSVRAIVLLQPFGPAGIVASTILTFAMFYAPHYLRLRVLQAEAPLSSLLPDGEAEFRRLFGRISSIRSLLIFAAPFIIALAAVILTSGASQPQLLGSIITFSSWTIGGATAVWTYFVSLSGIRGMGKADLKVMNYHLDKFLGLREIGALALTSALAYYSVLGAAVLIFATSAFPLGFQAFLGGLTAFGFVMFFVPLFSVHERMLGEKKAALEDATSRLATLYQNDSATRDFQDTPEMFYSISIADIRRREASSIATWPFDTRVVERLLAVTFTVTGILISAVLRNFLHF